LGRAALWRSAAVGGRRLGIGGGVEWHAARSSGGSRGSSGRMVGL
jgi:hypothetical protein